LTATAHRDQDSGMARVPSVRPLLLGFVVLLCALSMASRCYPPGSRVIIFMQGVYTSIDEDRRTEGIGWEDHAYDKMKAKFVAAGYDPAKLLNFSYAGGAVDEAGAWHPSPHSCEITDRPSADNLAVLERMLRDVRAKYPHAHFTLIGHSLGGYLAYLEGVRESQRPEEEKLHVDVIVTLDAPLNGVSADKKIALDVAVGCAKTYQAAAEIVADKENPDIRALREAQVEAMRSAGIRVATIGNNEDCLYDLPECTGGAVATVDDSQTQYISNADLVRRYNINTSTFTSHFAVIAFAQTLSDVVPFVGAP
jgi:pimeloyl-ACP methyl ester carboxylesterase